MVMIYDDVDSIEELVAKHDRIYLYGGGASCKLLMQSYWEDVLKGHVEAIVDANDRIRGAVIPKDDGVKVISIDDFKCTTAGKNEKVTMLLTPAFSAGIVEFLDGFPELDGISVYLFPLICNRRAHGDFPYRSEEREFIPRRIHYFWIGNKPMPESYQRNIEKWRRLCPDYEVKCWNEENYDFSKIPYLKRAFEVGGEALMFATDYARMDVLYRYGGIYMDTDVEMIKRPDEILYNKAFIGIEENGQVNSGSGMGTMQGHPMIRALMDAYETLDADDYGKDRGFAFNTFHETGCFIEHGFRMKNAYQVVEDVACFPKDVFMPLSLAGMEDCFTEKTVFNHRINPEHRKRNQHSYNVWKHRVIRQVDI